MQDYSKLLALFKDVEVLKSIQGILSWDTETMMAENSISYRMEQDLILQDIIYKKSTNSKLRSLYNSIDLSKLGSIEKRNVELIKQECELMHCLPKKLSSELVKASTQSLNTWKRARHANNFDIAKQDLESLFRLTKRKYEYYASVLGIDTYDAAISSYSSTLNQKIVDQEFSVIASKLPGIIDNIIARQKPINLDLSYRVNKQKAICKELMRYMGFDFKRGRLDKSIHPFCGGAIGDNRITTHYNKHNVLEAVFGTIHETGHGIYEQQLPLQYAYTPVCKAAGMMVHESQSLFMEFQLGGSKNFIDDLCILFKKYNPDFRVNADELYQHRKIVTKSSIRILADEVTYPLHILMRYEIEKSLFNGEIRISDLKAVWQAKFKQYFGYEPASDNEGCLQDIHWYMGHFGYFPSYTMGAMLAAQIACGLENKGIRYETIESFKEITKTLKELVHQKGDIDPKAMLQEIFDLAGQKTMSECWFKYIANKYGF